ncbi:MAG: PAS domain S-box protein [Proteobacteria bacterium]|nr:PAS domain S-box protein [Pseudomonadota bacterium]
MSGVNKINAGGVDKTNAALIAELEVLSTRLKASEGRRKQAEDALFEFEERYRNLIGGSIQGIFVHKDWKLVFANQAFATILGYNSVRELMALDNISDVFAPYEVDRLTVFRDARKRGGRVPKQYEFDVIRKDGSIITVLNIARVVSWEGEPAIQNAVLDISGRKQAEQRVLDEKERAENYLAIAGTMIVALSLQGTVTLVNRKGCEILGYDLIELLGTNWVDMVIPEAARQKTRKDFENAVNGKTNSVQHLVSEVVTKSGKRRLIEWHLTLIRDSKGGITGTLSSGEDISERERAARERDQLQAQLRQSDKLKTIGTLAGGIAHDFNNILTPIIGYSHMALSGVPKDSQAYSDLERVVKGADRAKELVNQILTFSRQGEPEIYPTHLDVIVKEALKLIEGSSAANVQIKLQVDSDCPPVMGDQSQLHQVVMNLCTNALNAMEKAGGVLEVILETFDVDSKFTKHRTGASRGKYVKLRIRDTGEGMDAETLERIFEPFFTTRGVGEGTGMGLATVHGIISSHGGDIFVDSEVGKGTTFDIYFPQTAHQVKATVTADVTIPEGSEHILFVDDEREIGDMARQFLERAGYSVTTETDSEEALQLFRNQPEGFDLVVTDQAMPKLYGVKLAEEILKVRPGIPIILISGFADTITLESLRERGIRDYIMKPLVGPELAQAIRLALDGPAL